MIKRFHRPRDPRILEHLLPDSSSKNIQIPIRKKKYVHHPAFPAQYDSTIERCQSSKPRGQYRFFPSDHRSTVAAGASRRLRIFENRELVTVLGSDMNKVMVLDSQLVCNLADFIVLDRGNGLVR
jgi:hypothetical protein